MQTAGNMDHVKIFNGETKYKKTYKKPQRTQGTRAEQTKQSQEQRITKGCRCGGRERKKRGSDKGGEGEESTMGTRK